MERPQLTARNHLGLILVLTVAMFSWSARAVVFNWDAISWTAGNLTGSYDIDATNPGNDLTITIAGDTGFFNTGYPANVTDLQGGLPTAEKNLKTDLNWTANTMAITITIDFHYAYGIDIAVLNLFDVDAGARQKFFIWEIPGTRPWQDVIKDIQATKVGGGLVYPTNVIGGAANTVTGSGSTWTVTGIAPAPSTGTGSGDGNVTIDFGTNALTQIKYTWAAGSDSVADPSIQFIGLYDFSFNKRIPEYHPGLISAAVCFLLVAIRLVRRRIPNFAT